VLDPSDVRRHTRRMRERERVTPLAKIARYGAMALALVAVVAAYWNRETLLGIRIDASAITDLFTDRPADGDSRAAGPSGEGAATVDAPAVVGTRLPTSLDEAPESTETVAPTPAAQPESSATAPAVAAIEPRAADPAPPVPETRPEPPAAPPEPPPPPPEPESFELGLERVTVSEAEASAAVLVLRLGDRRRASSVSWWTEDGTAKAGSDYVNLGVVSEKFAAAEQNRGIHIPIVGDHNAEGPESFFVYVRKQPGGGTDKSGPTTRIEVVINDDD
jgi:hypothetical protein